MYNDRYKSVEEYKAEEERLALENSIIINRRNKVYRHDVKTLFIMYAVCLASFLIFIILLYFTTLKTPVAIFFIIFVISLIITVFYGAINVRCPHCDCGGNGFSWYKVCPECGKSLEYSEYIDKIDMEMRENGKGVPYSWEINDD